MRMVIRFLQDHSLGGHQFQAGDFAEVDERVGKQMVDDQVAEAKTPTEYAEEERQRLEKERRRESLKERDKAMGDIRVVGERAELDPTGGFKSFGHFLQDVAHACGKPAVVSDALMKWHSTATARAKAEAVREKTLHSGENLVEFDDSQGGYLVPPEYLTRLYNISLESSIVRSRALFIPMGSNRVSMNAVVDEDHSTNLFGGITIYREGEAHQKTSSKPTFRQVEITLHKITGLTGVSDEMIEDSPQSMEPLLTDLFGQAMAFTEDDDYINGTGVGQPLGVLNAGCLIAQAAEPAQAADTVVAQNIIKMWSRLHPICMRNAVWLCDPDVLPQLYQMGLAVGTGGSVVFVPQGGLSASPYATLLGRPLIPTEHCPALGDQGDILLVDFAQYAIGGKSAGGGPKVASSSHIYFDYDLTAFRFVMRYDGQPLWRVAQTPLHGNTRSPIIVLAAR